MAETVADTRRLITKPQNLNDAYGPPSNFLEIDVSNPQTVGVGRGRFTTYEIRVKVRPSLPPDPLERLRPPAPAAPLSGSGFPIAQARRSLPLSLPPADSAGQPCGQAGVVSQSRCWFVGAGGGEVAAGRTRRWPLNEVLEEEGVG